MRPYVGWVIVRDWEGCGGKGLRGGFENNQGWDRKKYCIQISSQTFVQEPSLLLLVNCFISFLLCLVSDKK
jgi:hypothetical protein